MSKLSQAQFVQLLMPSVEALENREQARREPTGPTWAQLQIVEKEPTVAVKVLVQLDAGGSEVSGRRRVAAWKGHRDPGDGRTNTAVDAYRTRRSEGKGAGPPRKSVQYGPALSCRVSQRAPIRHPLNQYITKHTSSYEPGVVGSNPVGRARIQRKIKRLPRQRQALFFSGPPARDISSHLRFAASTGSVTRPPSSESCLVPTDDRGDSAGL
jgi:hypothetical protein